MAPPVISPRRPLGASILALFAVLVALLGCFASGSYFLIGASKGELADWVVPAMGTLLTALGYFALAALLWRGHSGLRWFAPLLLTLLAAWALVDTLRDEVLDLAAVLLFFLAALEGMAVIAWLRMPAGLAWGRRS